MVGYPKEGLNLRRAFYLPDPPEVTFRGIPGRLCSPRDEGIGTTTEKDTIAGNYLLVIYVPFYA